jgi:hypothetical protein
MEVRMSQQFLIPGMQNSQKAEPCPEALRTGSDGQQRRASVSKGLTTACKRHVETRK